MRRTIRVFALGAVLAVLVSLAGVDVRRIARVLWQGAVISGRAIVSGNASISNVAAQSASAYGTQFGTFGMVCDEASVTGGIMTSGSAVLGVGSATFSAGSVGKAILVPGAGAAGVDLKTTISAYTNSTTVTLAAAASTSVSSKTVWFGTDNTAAINNAISAALALPGGTLYAPAGSCAVPGQIAIPTLSASPANKQAALRITGQSASADAMSQGNAFGGSVWDMWYSGSGANVGKIQSLGAGQLEIDHLMLRDHGTDTTAFIYVTNTVLKLRLNSIYGNNTGVQGTNGQDAIHLGGDSAVGTQSNAADGPFQGYGTVIDSNFFQGVSRIVYARDWVNNVQVTNNTLFLPAAGVAPIEIDGSYLGSSGYGNYIAGNLLEVTNYQYAFKLKSANQNVFVGNGIWDEAAGYLAHFNLTSSSRNHIVMGMYSPSYPILSGDSTATQMSNLVSGGFGGAGVGLDSGMVEAYSSGTGDPEGVVTADRGKLLIDTIHGALYVKTTAGGNTGWKLIPHS